MSVENLYQCAEIKMGSLYRQTERNTENSYLHTNISTRRIQQLRLAFGDCWNRFIYRADQLTDSRRVDFFITDVYTYRRFKVYSLINSHFHSSISNDRELWQKLFKESLLTSDELLLFSILLCRKVRNKQLEKQILNEEAAAISRLLVLFKSWKMAIDAYEQISEYGALFKEVLFGTIKLSEEESLEEV